MGSFGESRQWMVAIGALAISIVATACNGNDGGLATSTTSETSALVEIGAPCANGGVLGKTADGIPVLCSGSELDGTILDSPVWRETASGDDLPLILGARESSAVALVKEMAPRLAQDGDHAVLVIIEEFAATARLASEREYPLDEGFMNLVDGVQDANSLSYKDSMQLIEAYLEGVVALKDPQDVASVYAARELDWYRNGSVLTHFGLVSQSSPEQEQQYLDAWPASAIAADDPDLAVTLGYENCALGSQATRYGEAIWWADNLGELVAEDPPSRQTDAAFEYLMATEWAATLLCPQFAGTWEEAKGLLQNELWYPTLAQYPGAQDLGLAGLFP
jgi:hypothetical protein